MYWSRFNYIPVLSFSQKTLGIVLKTSCFAILRKSLLLSKRCTQKNVYKVTQELEDGEMSPSVYLGAGGGELTTMKEKN